MHFFGTCSRKLCLYQSQFLISAVLSRIKKYKNIFNNWMLFFVVQPQSLTSGAEGELQMHWSTESFLYQHL